MSTTRPPPARTRVCAAPLAAFVIEARNLVRKPVTSPSFVARRAGCRSEVADVQSPRRSMMRFAGCRDG
jgi:hypothetical protein